VPEPTHVWVAFCCNAPESGTFTGRCDAVHVGEGELELVCNVARGSRMVEEDGAVWFAGHRFPVASTWRHSCASWVADTAQMSVGAARTLAEFLVGKGWNIEGANRAGPFADIAEKAWKRGGGPEHVAAPMARAIAGLRDRVNGEG
jgi:hypothetical protein